jgi:hypothetical protein
MRNSRLFRVIIAALLATYLIPAILSPRNLPGDALIFKLHSSLSVQNGRSIDLDERPYWTSHRHLTSSERFLSDHILSIAEPLMGAIAPEQSVEIQAAFLPPYISLFPQNALRAPPLS